jgi:hypothetical protein
MARKPDWYANFEPIMSRLSSLEPTRQLVRKNVEELFGVKRTEANRIMQIAGAQSIGQGAKTMIEVRTLVLYLESRRGDFKKERKRRNAFAHVVATEAAISPARYATFRLPPIPNFDALGDSLQFRNGVMSIRYESFEDLISKIISMGQAGLHQSDRFRELVEQGLIGEVSCVSGALLISGDSSEAVSGSRK